MRPEYATLFIDHREAAVEGEVAVVELLGTEYLVTVEGGNLSVQVTTPQAPRPGDHVWVTLDRDHALVYGEDGDLVGADQGRFASSAADTG